MILLLLILPAAAGLAAFVLPGSAARRGLLVGTAVAHAVLTAACWKWAPAATLGGWLALDPAGLLFLSITSGLFLAAAIYAVGYLRLESNRHIRDVEEGLLFDNAPEAVFIGCLLLFLSAMTLVTVSQHFGLLWVAIEATTLASAPLIYFHRHHRSLEATWKYLLICSVGIALALLANFFLGVAAAEPGRATFPLVLGDLLAHAPRIAGAVAEGGLSPVLRRLWHEDGTGAVAYLAPGRAQRGAVVHLGAAVRRGAELRVSRACCASSRSASPPAWAISAGKSGWPWDWFRWWWARCSSWVKRITNGCWPIRASSTWDCSRWAWGWAA